MRGGRCCTTKDLLTKNYTSYNFQVLRDDAYFLSVDGTVTGHRIAPARSSCAVLVSSQNANREWLYYTQQTISAEGFSGQAFSSYVPHTVRAKETKQCSDCHVSAANDNNAWMAQLGAARHKLHELHGPLRVCGDREKGI